MRDAISEPDRLRDRHDQLDLVERIAGQAARDTAEPEPLSAIAMARIAGRIDGRRGGHRVSPLGWALVVGAFLLGVVTTASAAHLDLLPGWLTRIVPSLAARPASPTTPARRSRAVKTEPAVPASPTVAPPEEVLPAPAAELQPTPPPQAKAAPSPAGHRGPTVGPHKGHKVALLTDETPAPAVAVAPRPAPPLLPAAETSQSLPPPVASPPGATTSGPAPSSAASATAHAAPPPAATAPSASPQTAGVLKEIVRALRVEHAPHRALALLDQHSNALAGQAFAEESLLLRVEAMLALGQRTAVLRLLDRTPLADLAVASTLLITRGELRAAANRCAEGIGDFDLALAASRRPPKSALLGRARCKQQLGDVAGAQADLARYQHEFPDDPPR